MSTKVIVATAPTCDIHQYEKGVEGVVAKYDGKTKRGPWANMCEECFGTHGIGLGTGRGQELIVKTVETTGVVEMGTTPGERFGYECAACQMVSAYGERDTAEKALATHLAECVDICQSCGVAYNDDGHAEDCEYFLLGE